MLFTFLFNFSSPAVRRVVATYELPFERGRELPTNSFWDGLDWKVVNGNQESRLSLFKSFHEYFVT